MINDWVIFVAHVPCDQKYVKDATEGRLFYGVALTYPYVFELAALVVDRASHLEALTVGAV
jgi:hypothetical protein